MIWLDYLDDWAAGLRDSFGLAASRREIIDIPPEQVIDLTDAPDEPQRQLTHGKDD